MKRTDFQGELGRLHAASFGWALWCCDHQRDEAEEVLQTAYLKVAEGMASFDGKSSLQTWFFGVIRRTAWEQRRRRWLRERKTANDQHSDWQLHSGHHTSTGFTAVIPNGPETRPDSRRSDRILFRYAAS